MKADDGKGDDREINDNLVGHLNSWAHSIKVKTTCKPGSKTQTFDEVVDELLRASAWTDLVQDPACLELVERMMDKSPRLKEKALDSEMLLSVLTPGRLKVALHLVANAELEDEAWWPHPQLSIARGPLVAIG